MNVRTAKHSGPRSSQEIDFTELEFSDCVLAVDLMEPFSDCVLAVKVWSLNV
jgi:hypothetical protein